MRSVRDRSFLGGPSEWMWPRNPAVVFSFRRRALIFCLSDLCVTLWHCNMGIQSLHFLWQMLQHTLKSAKVCSVLLTEKICRRDASEAADFAWESPRQHNIMYDVNEPIEKSLLGEESEISRLGIFAFRKRQELANKLWIIDVPMKKTCLGQGSHKSHYFLLPSKQLTSRHWLGGRAKGLRIRLSAIKQKSLKLSQQHKLPWKFVQNWNIKKLILQSFISSVRAMNQHYFVFCCKQHFHN